MEHAVHLGAGHFIRIVSPTSARTLARKIKKTLENGQLDDTTNPLEQDAGDADDEANNEANNEDADEDAVDFTVGDTIGKSLALIKQIRSSPQATAFFRECCRQAGVPELALIQWIRTRWASMHNFLERMLILQKVSIRIFNAISTSITIKL